MHIVFLVSRLGLMIGTWLPGQIKGYKQVFCGGEINIQQATGRSENIARSNHLHWFPYSFLCSVQ